MAVACGCKEAVTALACVLYVKFRSGVGWAAGRETTVVSATAVGDMFSDGAVEPSAECWLGAPVMVACGAYAKLPGGDRVCSVGTDFGVPLIPGIPQPELLRALFGDAALSVTMDPIAILAGMRLGPKYGVEYVGFVGRGRCSKCGRRAKFEIRVGLKPPETQ